MKAQGCRADAIVYNAIIDALWETGVVWVQRRALRLFRTAVEEGHFHQGKLVPGLARAEVNLHAMTAGVAMLSLYAWLVSLKQLLVQHGGGALPLRLAVVTDRGKGAKEQGNLVVKEAVAAAMALWGAPFRCAELEGRGWGPEGADPQQAQLLVAALCAHCAPPASGPAQGVSHTTVPSHPHAGP
jgi:pentatricopeptide repeat domain-containing protein 1